MAIRDTFRRALRRSGSASSQTSSHNDSSNSSTAASTADSEQTSLHKTPSRLTTWSWSSNAKAKEEQLPRERKPKNKTRTKKAVVHPSQRPLTAQNLLHQEMLSHFTMTFGTSRPEQIETESFIGISPCCTRTPSLAGDSDDDYSPNSSGSATPQLSDGGR